jgi:hypothetical protein
MKSVFTADKREMFEHSAAPPFSDKKKRGNKLVTVINKSLF